MNEKLRNNVQIMRSGLMKARLAEDKGSGKVVQEPAILLDPETGSILVCADSITDKDVKDLKSFATAYVRLTFNKPDQPRSISVSIQFQQYVTMSASALQLLADTFTQLEQVEEAANA